MVSSGRIKVWLRISEGQIRFFWRVGSGSGPRIRPSGPEILTREAWVNYAYKGLELNCSAFPTIRFNFMSNQNLRLNMIYSVVTICNWSAVFKGRLYEFSQGMQSAGYRGQNANFSIPHFILLKLGFRRCHLGDPMASSTLPSNPPPPLPPQPISAPAVLHQNEV